MLKSSPINIRTQLASDVGTRVLFESTSLEHPLPAVLRSSARSRSTALRSTSASPLASSAPNDCDGAPVSPESSNRSMIFVLLFRAAPFRRRSLKNARVGLRCKGIRPRRTGQCRQFSTNHRAGFLRSVWDRANILQKCLHRAAKAFRYRAAKVFGRSPVREFPLPFQARVCQPIPNGWMVVLVPRVSLVPGRAN